MAPPLQAAIYVRISRDAEAEGLGVKRQERDCRELGDRLGWSVVEIFVDNDVSASKSKPRPAYQRMMKAVKAKRLQAVIVWDVDRLTRKPRELEDWIDHANALGLKLASVGGEIDLSTEQGRAMARMKGVFARLEAETIARRQRAKHKEMAQAGRYLGRRPFGYRFATDERGALLTGSRQRLVIDPTEAAVLKECVRRVLDHEALWSIVKDLNERGITTATGSSWAAQPLRRVLLRWVHAGYRKHQEFKDGKWVGKVDLIKGDWPAIIERETHERVIALLTNPDRTSNHGDTELKYLLTWLATCGACGRQLAGAKGYEYEVKGYKRVDGSRSPSRMRVYPAKYGCPHAGCHGVSRRMDVVDSYVERYVVALLKSEGIQLLGGDQRVADEARVRASEIEAQLDLYADERREGLISDREWRRLTSPLRPQLEAENRRYRAAMPVDGLDGFEGPGAADAWAEADISKKRTVLRALIELAGLKITIDKIGPGPSLQLVQIVSGIYVDWESNKRFDST